MNLAELLRTTTEPLPFAEGDEYYTTEAGRVIWSVWDDVSAELHTKGRTYYSTKEQAEKALKTEKK